ncbi:RsfA family transcriptional regulator [Metabacillus arenae]|uniref:RsfA family transcriptional regulator n=1 Tax=Metabacillus arenae TaxID=2771434 RepID=A0A926NNW3_9BACI|nr:RsfA family transcriptional regulator [Metabacillus arenae]MBD1381246.1 RsfA family transcriptional regulator [Metabacillus arenae]
MKTRKDAWTKENDLLLAETVNRYIQEGRPQSAAFEKVGDILSRTSGACGYRWNAKVRKHYGGSTAAAREPAALKEKDKKISMTDCVSFLESYSQGERMEVENSQLKSRNKALLEKNRSLTEKLKAVQNKLASVEKEYRTIVTVIEQAKSMTETEKSMIH